MKAWLQFPTFWLGFLHPADIASGGSRFNVLWRMIYNSGPGDSQGLCSGTMDVKWTSKDTSSSGTSAACASVPS
jgi:hypothetical protein